METTAQVHARLSTLPQTAWSGMHPDRLRVKEG